MSTIVINFCLAAYLRGTGADPESYRPTKDFLAAASGTSAIVVISREIPNGGHIDVGMDSI